MIGQKSLLKVIDSQIDHDKFPHFILLVGSRGSGKKLLCKSIARKLGASYCVVEPKVDDVRQLRDTALEGNMQMFFAIDNAGKLSLAGKNALLKLAEECPSNVYLVALVESITQVPETLISRAYVMRMETYSHDELISYALSRGHLTGKELDVITKVCITPGDVDLLLKSSVMEFYGYVCKVVDNIGIVSGANAFKIGQSISFKDSQEGYDLQMFLHAFMAECCARIKDNPRHYAKGIRVTSKYLQQLDIVGINKESTFDNWMLDIRQVWW